MSCGHGGGGGDDDDVRLHPRVSGGTCANVSTGGSTLSNQSPAVPAEPLADQWEDSPRPWVWPDKTVVAVVAAAAVEVGIVVSDMEVADIVIV